MEFTEGCSESGLAFVVTEVAVVFEDAEVGGEGTGGREEGGEGGEREGGLEVVVTVRGVSF